jgi:hypothetical protein
MSKIIPIMIALFFLASNQSYAQVATKALEYRNGKEVFTVVVVKGEQNKKQTKERALKKAATIAQKYGFRSFNIISEQEVEVILGKTNWPSAYDFPQNLYQEEIVEKGYNRERFISGSKSDYKLRKSLKIQIKCFNNDGEGSYKVCDLISC